MDDSNHTNITTLLKTLIETYIKRLSNLTQLASLEAKLAGKTLIKITILLLIAIFLVASAWFSLLLVTYLYLVSLHYSWLCSAIIVACINIFLLVLVLMYILIIKKYLFFPATRRQIGNTHLNSAIIVKKDAP